MPDTEDVRVSFTADTTALATGVREGQAALRAFRSEADTTAKSTFQLTRESTNFLSSILAIRTSVSLSQRALRAFGVENQAVAASFDAISLAMDVVASGLLIIRALHLQAGAASMAHAVAAWFSAAAESSIFTFGLGAAAIVATAAGTLVALKALGVPLFAEGGVVMRPTLGVLGERGPEAVIPLSRSGGSGVGPSVHIENLSVQVQANDVDDFMRKLGRRLSQLQNAGGF